MCSKTFLQTRNLLLSAISEGVAMFAAPGKLETRIISSPVHKQEILGYLGRTKRVRPTNNQRGRIILVGSSSNTCITMRCACRTSSVVLRTHLSQQLSLLHVAAAIVTFVDTFALSNPTPTESYYLTTPCYTIPHYTIPLNTTSHSTASHTTPHLIGHPNPL